LWEVLLLRGAAERVGEALLRGRVRDLGVGRRLLARDLGGMSTLPAREAECGLRLLGGMRRLELGEHRRERAGDVEAKGMERLHGGVATAVNDPVSLPAAVRMRCSPWHGRQVSSWKMVKVGVASPMLVSQRVTLLPSSLRPCISVSKLVRYEIPPQIQADTGLRQADPRIPQIQLYLCLRFLQM
jgi:hypothetical protein